MNTDEQIKRILREIRDYHEANVSVNSSTCDAVFVGGLESVISMASQKKLFEDGFGKEKYIKYFSHTAQTSEVIGFLSKNPKVPVFLYSAGCRKAYDLCKSSYVDKNMLFLIEPTLQLSEEEFLRYKRGNMAARYRGKTIEVVMNAISSGLPRKNVFVSPRLMMKNKRPIINGISSSGAPSHFAAVTSVAKMVRQRFK